MRGCRLNSGTIAVPDGRHRLCERIASVIAESCIYVASRVYVIDKKLCQQIPKD
jgi:hypothetical protein